MLARAVFNEDVNEPLDADADTALEPLEAAFALAVCGRAEIDVDRRANLRVIESGATPVISLIACFGDSWKSGS